MYTHAIRNWHMSEMGLPCDWCGISRGDEMDSNPWCPTYLFQYFQNAFHLLRIWFLTRYKHYTKLYKFCGLHVIIKKNHNCQGYFDTKFSIKNLSTLLCLRFDFVCGLKINWTESELTLWSLTIAYPHSSVSSELNAVSSIWYVCAFASRSMCTVWLVTWS